MDQELCKRGQSEGNWQAEVSSGVQSKAKCEIRVQFLTFFCAKFMDFMNTGAQLGQYLCTNTQIHK